MEGIKTLHCFMDAQQSFQKCPFYILENVQVPLVIFHFYLQGGNKARTQTNLSSGSGSGASLDTVYSSQEQPCFDDPLPASNSSLR